MTDANPTHPVVKYKDLPDILTTNMELFHLVFAVSRKYDQPTYAGRLTAKGMTHLDLASEVFITLLDGSHKASHRRSKGGSSPANEITLPIKKDRAYSVIANDMLDIIRKRTPEEKAHVQLVPESEVK